MPNGFSTIVTIIDIFLAAACFVLAAAIVLYGWQEERRRLRRQSRLSRIRSGLPQPSHQATEQLFHDARSSKNRWRRIDALVSLGLRGNEQALDICAKAIDESDEDISYFAMMAVAHIATPSAARVLLGYIPGHPHSGHKIASFLEMFPPSAVDALLEAAHAPQPSLRFWALRVLARFKDPRCVAEAVRLAGDPSDDVRAASCVCLAEFGDERGIAALVSLLRDRAWFVRLHALRALAKIKGTGAEEYAAFAANDTSWLVSEEAGKIMRGEPS